MGLFNGVLGVAVVVGICGACGAVRVGGCNFYYSAFSYWCRRNLGFGDLGFGEGTGHWVIILSSFEIFLIFPNFLRFESQVVR